MRFIDKNIKTEMINLTVFIKNRDIIKNSRFIFLGVFL